MPDFKATGIEGRTASSDYINRSDTPLMGYNFNQFICIRIKGHSSLLFEHTIIVFLFFEC